MAKEFTTADLYLAAAICLILKSAPTYRVENHRTQFIFPISEDLYQAITDYHNGAALNAFEYTLILKRLRSEMIMRRETGGVR